jgi:hypothetical protein
VRLGKLSTLFEPTNDFVAFGQITNGIPAVRMRLDRKNLAVDPKAADAIVSAELEGGQQCVSVRQTEAAQLHHSVRSFHLADGSSRRRDKFDRLIPKYAAEAQAW